jgi:hypothetical protein
MQHGEDDHMEKTRRLFDWCAIDVNQMTGFGKLFSLPVGDVIVVTSTHSEHHDGKGARPGRYDQRDKAMMNRAGDLRVMTPLVAPRW